VTWMIGSSISILSVLLFLWRLHQCDLLWERRDFAVWLRLSSISRHSDYLHHWL
jgi:hypothetical protein